MRKKLVAGNWKMNGNTRDNNALLGEVVASNVASNIDIAVFPPFVYLAQASNVLKSQNSVVLGAQNLNMELSGAYTGEVSGAMLVDVGCQMVLVGHSERRQLYGESDEIVAQKAKAALTAGLTPVLCVGESLQERENGQTIDVVGRQVRSVLDHCGIRAFEKIVLAYEPVWAIGTGLSASSEQAQEVHFALRGLVAGIDAGVAEKLRILYGGSVKPANAAELFAMPDIDGGLIGGASLVAKDFLAICDAAL